MIGIVKAQAFEGAYNMNPFNFEHHGLKYVSLVVDGKNVPQKPLVCDFNTHSTLRNHLTMLKSTGKVFNNGGVDIDRSDYENGYSILAFDLTPDLDEIESRCYHVIKKGNIQLELKFGAGLPAPVNVVVYSGYDSSIRIDKNRAILTNYYS